MSLSSRDGAGFGLRSGRLFVGSTVAQHGVDDVYASAGEADQGGVVSLLLRLLVCPARGSRSGVQQRSARASATASPAAKPRRTQCGRTPSQAVRLELVVRRTVGVGYQ
jgi:hypothetical protein